MRARAITGLRCPGRHWRSISKNRRERGRRWGPAWRQAAHQAESRHAFDDAALCYSRALSTLDDQPDASRARLLLELAAAQIGAGDLDAGRRNSSEAFRIGESLADPELLADSALTYGTIFTFGSVDPRLVNLLKFALERIGEGDIDRRARLQARLAAAMQPAADPSEPVALAQEAIRLARAAAIRARC